MAKPLRSRFVRTTMGVVAVAFVITAFFMVRQTARELTLQMEEEVQGRIRTLKNHVQSQHNSMLYHRSIVLERRKQELKNNISMAVTIVERAHREFNAGRLTQDAAKKQAVQDLKRLRYDNGTGYFWINDTTRPIPRMVMHPIFPHLDGTVLEDPKFNCALGTKENLFKVFVHLCLQKGAGFVQCLWPKPMAAKAGETTQKTPLTAARSQQAPQGEFQSKISYVKRFQPWEWVIGTGVYMDDIEKEVKGRYEAVVLDLKDIVAGQSLDGTGEYFIFDAHMALVAPARFPAKEIPAGAFQGNGKALFKQLKTIAAGPVRPRIYIWDLTGTGDGSGGSAGVKRIYVSYYAPLGWTICGIVSQSRVTQRVTALIWKLGLWALALLALTTLAAWWMAGRMVAPMGKLADSLEKAGDKGEHIRLGAGTRYTDIGAIADKFNHLIDVVNEIDAQLKEQREFAHCIIDGAPDMICGILPGGKVTFMNPSAQDISGYGEEEFVGKNWRELFLNGDDGQQVNILRNKLAQGEIVDYEVTMVCKNGDLKEIVWNTFTRRDVDHEIVEIICFGRDITQRKAAENAARLVQYGINRARDCIFWLNSETRLVYVNDSSCSVLGYSREELLHMTIDQIDPNLKPGSWPERLAVLRRRKSITHESMHRTKDGRVFPVEVTGNYLVFEGEEGSFSFARDITERKRAEEELKRLRNYLSNIIDSMPSMLVGVDSLCRVTLWNNRAVLTTRIPAKEARGRILIDVLPWMEQEMESIGESIRTMEIKYDPKRRCRVDDQIRFEDVTIYPLMDGNVQGAVIRIDDVTEKVRMEEMMVQSEKMLSVGGLAAGMAHEINNPLAGMMQTANVLANRLDKEADIPANIETARELGTTMETIQEFMETRGIKRMIKTINDSGQRVADIVNNMLSFARKGEAKPAFHRLDLLMDKALELAATDYDLKTHYDFKMVKIKKEYQQGLSPILCEGAQIQQVLLNVLRNGAQAMQDAGTEEPMFILRTRFDEKSRMLCMEIEDNGPGMTEEIRKRVFEPFFTSKPVGLGTGLGLSVSYFIITENHGGQMSVESQPGAGARFIIRLPMEKKKNT